MSPDPRRRLLDLLQQGIQAVDGFDAVCRHLESNPVAGPVHMVAIGKAACAMARGADAVLSDGIAGALVVTKQGYAERLRWPVIEAGHPVPDRASLKAGDRLEEFIANLPATTNVLVLLSGGASSLIEQLPPGVSLEDLQRVNRWLLGSGLDIHDMNVVRKRMSLIKGGRLAERLFPHQILCLAISDVPGNDPRSIGSGPLTPDPSKVKASQLAPFIRDMLVDLPPLPPENSGCFGNVRMTIVADNRAARLAIMAGARSLGWRVVMHDDLLQGDATETGVRLARLLATAPSGTLHVWGGETVVKLPDHPGRGGRCQQLALAAARELAGTSGAWLLAAATDGSDGPGEDAGALVDGDTVVRGEAEGQQVELALARADAGHFLEASGDLMTTGPTGTNVMDLVLGLRL